MRHDIQFLRGMAVLLVVIYHADIGVVSYGYLGVDVFFVISGFLITSIIIRDLNSGNFSFTVFYLRRAKRLLPALYCTLSCVSLLSYLFLTAEQTSDYIAQLIGSITFAANMVLPTQIGYFENAAEGKPLLHIWSLSLEEQYYFFLPIFLFLTTKRYRFWFLIVAFSISLFWCLSWTSNPDASAPFLWRFGETRIGEWAFYLFPTRAWELLAGSICAWLMIHYSNIAISPLLKLLSLILIIITSCISWDSVHPRIDAFVIVVATSILILGKDDWLPEYAPVRWIERIGDWSYSVYLIHWPLFAFAYLGYAELIPINSKIILIFASIFLGFLQFRYIEIPFRYGWNRSESSTWLWFATSTAAVFFISIPLVIGNVTYDQKADLKFAKIRKINYGLSEKCNHWFFKGDLDSACITGPEPKIAVWGDSYAMHLVPGLAERSENLIQLTKSVCGPIVGIAPIDGRYTSDWAEKCIRHNEMILKFIVEHDSISHIILSSSFNQYFKESNGNFLVDGVITPKNPSLAIKAFESTIKILQTTGKHITVVTPPPRSGFNIGECLEREDSNIYLLRKSCDISVLDYQHYDAEINQALSAIEKISGVDMIWLSDSLCDQEFCRTRLGDIYVYRDGGHLSISGSRALLRNLVFRDL